MNAVELWNGVSTLARAALAVLLVYKLFVKPDTYNWLERMGMGGLASGCLLTVPTIWLFHASPFEGWGTALYSLGGLAYFGGRTLRHWLRNEQTRRAARRHLARRGRLKGRGTA